MDLLAYRTQLNVTCEDAAKQLKVNSSSYNRWERGETMPTPVNVRAIRRWSNNQVTIGDLMDTYWKFEGRQ